MIILGLTGSIGMGKSTAVKIFNDLGYPSHSSDDTVHQLLDYNGDCVEDVTTLFPHCVKNNTNGQIGIDRKKLGQEVFSHPEKLKKLEMILHPMVINSAKLFLKDCLAKGEDLAILDIPLLYETNGEQRCDAVLVVTAPYEDQRKRVLARPNMTEEKFKLILDKQYPNEKKISRADFVIEMVGGMDQARNLIKRTLPEILAIKPKKYKEL